MVNTQSELMTRAQALMKQKDDIEAEINKFEGDLRSMKVGMNDRLVDSEGFPRSDVDLVAVTTARSSIVKLRNDHKTVMQQIEEAIHAVHAAAIAERLSQKETEAGASSGETVVTSSTSSTTLSPFAKVNAVAPDSPAQEAGLLQGDKIVAFGPIDSNNSNAMQNLAQHVGSRENLPILVKVLRGESHESHSLILVPRQGWGGRGLLGCHLLPA